MQLVFTNSSINIPAANVITRVSYYTSMHVSTLNFLLNARFFVNRYTFWKFSTNNKNIMQPWNFSTMNNLHYAVCLDRSYYVIKPGKYQTYKSS